MREARNVEGLKRSLESLKKKSSSQYILFTSHCRKVILFIFDSFNLFTHSSEAKSMPGRRKEAEVFSESEINVENYSFPTNHREMLAYPDRFLQPISQKKFLLSITDSTTST